MFPLYIPSSKALSGKSPVISESGLLSCLLKEMLVSRTVKLRLLLLWVFFEFLPKNDNCMVIDDLRDTLDHGGEECLDHKRLDP